MISMTKVLVIGSTGFLGRNIIKQDYGFTIIGSYNNKKTKDSLIKIDLNNHDIVKKNILAHKPSIVIDASDFKFEKMDEKSAIKTSTYNTKNLISICHQTKAHLLFISSDSVFDGQKGNYTEQDNSNPISLYGKIKYFSEKAIRENAKNFLIIRTSMLFGWEAQKWNFVSWVIDNLKNKKAIEVIKDQFVSPSYCPNVAEMIFETIRLDLKGIIHLAGSSQLTRLEFAKLICETFSFDEKLLLPIRLNETDLDLIRGKNTTLNVDKAKNLLKIKPLTALESLTKMKEIQN